MPRTLEITVPPDRTQRLIEEIGQVEGLLGYRVQRGISADPPGDVVSVSTTNRSLQPILKRLEEQRLLEGKDWSLTLSEPTGMVAPGRRSAIEEDTTEIVWEEMDFTLLRESNMMVNALVVMAASGFMAAVGLGTGTLHLVIAAMVIAPGFEPIIRIALNRVSGSGAWQRGVTDTLRAYAALFLGALAGGLVLAAIGEPLLTEGQGYLPAEGLRAFWVELRLPSLVTAAFAGTAGAVLIASNRSVLTAGVMIGLALVPPPAIAALGVLGGDLAVAARAILRWVIEVGIVAAAGFAVFMWKQRTVQERRMALQ